LNFTAQPADALQKVKTFGNVSLPWGQQQN